MLSRPVPVKARKPPVPRSEELIALSFIIHRNDSGAQIQGPQMKNTGKAKLAAQNAAADRHAAYEATQATTAATARKEAQSKEEVAARMAAERAADLKADVDQEVGEARDAEKVTKLSAEPMRALGVCVEGRGWEKAAKEAAVRRAALLTETEAQQTEMTPDLRAAVAELKRAAALEASLLVAKKEADARDEQRAAHDAAQRLVARQFAAAAAKQVEKTKKKARARELAEAAAEACRARAEADVAAGRRVAAEAESNRPAADPIADLAGSQETEPQTGPARWMLGVAAIGGIILARNLLRRWK